MAVRAGLHSEQCASPFDYAQDRLIAPYGAGIYKFYFQP